MLAKIFQLLTGLAAAQTAVQGMQLKMQAAARRTIYSAFAGFLALVAAGFLLAALWLWLDALYGATITNLAFGGGLLVVALIVATVAANMGKSTQPQATATASPGDTTAQISDLLGEIESLAKEDGGNLKALALAALAGVVIAKLLWK